MAPRAGTISSRVTVGAPSEEAASRACELNTQMSWSSAISLSEPSGAGTLTRMRSLTWLSLSDGKSALTSDRATDSASTSAAWRPLSSSESTASANSNAAAAATPTSVRMEIMPTMRPAMRRDYRSESSRAIGSVRTTNVLRVNQAGGRAAAISARHVAQHSLRRCDTIGRAA